MGWLILELCAATESELGRFARHLLLTPLCVTPRGAAALTGAENAQESWMCTQSHRTLGRLRLSSSPH